MGAAWQALDHYQREHTRGYQQLDSSIIAKAHMSIGKAYERLSEFDDAAKARRSASDGG